MGVDLRVNLHAPKTQLIQHYLHAGHQLTALQAYDHSARLCIHPVHDNELDTLPVQWNVIMVAKA